MDGVEILEEGGWGKRAGYMGRARAGWTARVDTSQFVTQALERAGSGQWPQRGEPGSVSLAQLGPRPEGVVLPPLWGAGDQECRVAGEAPCCILTSTMGKLLNEPLRYQVIHLLSKLRSIPNPLVGSDPPSIVMGTGCIQKTWHASSCVSRTCGALEAGHMLIVAFSQTSDPTPQHMPSQGSFLHHLCEVPLGQGGVAAKAPPHYPSHCAHT